MYTAVSPHQNTNPHMSKDTQVASSRRLVGLVPILSLSFYSESKEKKEECSFNESSPEINSLNLGL